MKRLLSALLVFCLLVSSGICVPAYAEETTADESDQTQEQPQEGPKGLTCAVTPAPSPP